MDADTQTIYEEIINVAKNGDVVYYSEIAPLIGLDLNLTKDRNRIIAILDGINKAEHGEGRRLLTAVVVNKNRKIPGAGFFKLAIKLGFHSSAEDDFKFWLKELRRVHKHWRKIGTARRQARNQ